MFDFSINNNISERESINVVWYKLADFPLFDSDFRIWVFDSPSEFEEMKRQNIGKTWIAADTDICLHTVTGNSEIRYLIDNLYYRFGCRSLVNGSPDNIIKLSECVTQHESRFDKKNPNHEISNPALRMSIIKYNQYTTQKLIKVQGNISNELVNNIINELKHVYLVLPCSKPADNSGKINILYTTEFKGSTVFSAYTDLDAIPEKYKKQGYGTGYIQPIESFIEYAQNNNLPMTINMNSPGGGFLVLSQDYPLILSSETSDKQKAELFLNDAVKYQKKGDAESLKQAVECYFEAAKLNNSTAQNNLAVLLKSGYADVRPNPQAALYWFEKAADEVADAAFTAGRIYDLGDNGIAPDIKKAAYYYEKAAKMNHPTALFNLGAMYWNGDYYEKNREKGYSLIAKAASLGCPEAVKLLKG